MTSYMERVHELPVSLSVNDCNSGFLLRPSFSGFVFEMLPIRIEVCIFRSLCLSLCL